jgi:hypothetical protein
MTLDFFDVKVLVIGAAPVLFAAYRWVLEGTAIHWKDVLPLASAYATVLVGVSIWSCLKAPEELATDAERDTIVRDALADCDEADRRVLQHLLVVGQMTEDEVLYCLQGLHSSRGREIFPQLRNRTQLLTYNRQTWCYEIKPALREPLRKALKKHSGQQHR